MKNSASNLLITQACQTQSIPLLAHVTAVLTDFGYFKLVHQRVSQQFMLEEDVRKNVIHQGLTHAKHSNFGCVMIKWDLIPTNMESSFEDSFNNSFDDSFDDSKAADRSLSHEINILNHLKSNCSHSASLAPTVLDNYVSELQLRDTSDRLNFYVMPYYKNGNLNYYLKQNKQLSDKQKYRLILQSAQLIANLHYRGWLHNDIKPSNFLLDDCRLNHTDNDSIAPNLLLTDFALAQDSAKENNGRQTISGTPAYLAPERWQGQSATVQSDIYAFGVMVFEIMRGERPFSINKNNSNKAQAWAIQHCQTPIPKLIKEHAHYQDIINTALSKRVAGRYQSMEVLLTDLRALEALR